jgi:DNA processing protein
VRRELALESEGRLFATGEETEPGPGPSNQVAALNPAARGLLQKLRIETATHVDDLLGAFEELSSSEIIAALFELEMAGLVRQLPGKNFVKVW